MKTTKKFLRSLAGFIPALLLTLAVAAHISAAPGGDLVITIKNNTGLPKMTDGQFVAYQLFKGDPAAETPSGENVTENDYGAANWNNYSLADIEWGDGVKGDGLLAALKALDYDANHENLPEFFDEGNVNVFAGVNDAKGLAELLVGKTNAFLQEFSGFVVKGVGESYLGETKYDSKAENGDAPENDQSVITVGAPGYYLIVENNRNIENSADAISEYILAVLGNQEISLKASVPAVDKDIVGSEGSLLKGDVAGIGDTVNFRLTGTLPKNLADYKEYYYAFKDTLSKGLTYTGNIKVTVRQGGKDYVIDPTEYKAVPAEPDFVLPDEGGTVIQVIFENLKKETSYISSSDGESAGKIFIGSDDTIYVDYTAVLNENAVIGKDGNPNDVFLEYSNDPNSDDKGETEKKIVYVYSFGLDITKVGSDAEHSKGLEGAGFTLKNSEGKIAKFKGGDAKKTIESWVDESEYDESDAYVLKSGADGKLPQVSGLDTGKYTLTEVVTPDGYNTLEPFDFKIEATINPGSGALEEIKYYAPADAESPSATYTASSDGSQVFETGLIPQTLENRKAPFLPFTGGRGALICYIAGGILLAGAALYLIFSRKRGKSGKQAAK